MSHIKEHSLPGMSNNGPSPSIMLIDDEPVSLTVLSELLQTFGFVVYQAHDLDQAQSFLEHSTPDLILADIIISEKDSLNFIPRLRSRGKQIHIPIIIINARPIPEDKAKSEEAGANAYLPKPFSTNELLKTIDHVLMGTYHHGKLPLNQTAIG
jgi:two-component system chemotaxis response regulator CheY